MKWVPSRAGLFALFLGLGLLVLVGDRYFYKKHSRSQDDFVASAGQEASGTVQATVKELASRLERRPLASARYAVAAEKNLFAPDRQAWQPPAPRTPEPEPEDDKPEDVPAPQRRDVVLYGTYIAGGQKKALLHFKRLRKGRFLLAEGEEAVDDEEDNGPRSRRPSYTLLKVEQKSVQLKDDRGSEFSIGLYDNKQRRPVKTASTGSTPNIQVEAATTAPAAATTANDANSAGDTKAAPALTAKQIRKMSVEDKESLVKSGELIKHNTPFGPVYKRARK